MVRSAQFTAFSGEIWRRALLHNALLVPVRQPTLNRPPWFGPHCRPAPPPLSTKLQRRFNFIANEL